MASPMTFKSKIIAGFGIALVILILVGALSFRGMVRNGEDRVWVTHTYLVLEKLDGVLANLVDAETGQRGYILTGEESYLEPYNDGIKHVHENVKELREMTADNPGQQRAIDRLEPLIVARLLTAQDRISIRRGKGLEAGIEGIRTSPGKQQMDQIRAQIAEMKLEEDRLLKLRSEEANASSRTTSGLYQLIVY
jgi:CHASE3 domain sensor protein